MATWEVSSGGLDWIEDLVADGRASKLRVDDYFRYERHFVYWRRLSNGDIGIVTILHERMHQIERLRDDFFGEPPQETGSPDS